jgi:hypothetical protein
VIEAPLRDNDPNGRAIPLRALDTDGSAQQTRPFLDAQQAKSCSATLHSGWTKAILNLEDLAGSQ